MLRRGIRPHGVLNRSQFTVEFRYLLKYGLYWKVFCRSERLLPLKHGCAINYHCLAKFGLGSECFRRGFAQFTSSLYGLQVPHGFFAELPPVFTYRILEFCDPDLPWWVTTYTEFAAKVVAYIIFEFYDSCRLWALIRDMLEGIRRLNLETFLGNAGKCLSLLDAI